MSSISHESDEGFRLSQLLYDTRYRSLTIQVIAFILLVLALSWLVWNTIQNLAALGKDFNFGFLGERAGYDINQRLIEYDSNSTHWRAATVGILNTLLVSFMGCILATVFGVIAGVLRLSNNWIVGRLMTVYVEGFRNVPLLLWILLIFAVFTEGLPLPNSYRAAADTGVAENEMMLFGTTALTNQGTFVPRPVFAEGAWMFVVAFALAVAAIWALRRYRDKRQKQTGDITPVFLPSIAILIFAMVGANFMISAQSRNNEIALIAVGADSGTTLADLTADGTRLDYCRIVGSGGSFSVQNALEDQGVSFREKAYFGQDDARRNLVAGNCKLLAVPAGEAADVATALQTQIAGGETVGVLSDTFLEGKALQFDMPAMTEKGIPRFEGGMTIRNPLIALWLALSLYTGAFIAEIVRGGILAISKGQTEAAFALGLQPGRTMSLVVLPQAMRVIIPPLISQYLNLTKNSSLALAVGYMDVRSTLGGITINQTGRELEAMLLMAGFYLAVSLIISGVMNVYNRSIALKER